MATAREFGRLGAPVFPHAGAVLCFGEAAATVRAPPGAGWLVRKAQCRRHRGGPQRPLRDTAPCAQCWLCPGRSVRVEFSCARDLRSGCLWEEGGPCVPAAVLPSSGEVQGAAQEFPSRQSELLSGPRTVSEEQTALGPEAVSVCSGAPERSPKRPPGCGRHRPDACSPWAGGWLPQRPSWGLGAGRPATRPRNRAPPGGGEGWKVSRTLSTSGGRALGAGTSSADGFGPVFKPCALCTSTSCFSKETSSVGFCDDGFIETFAIQVTQVVFQPKSKTGECVTQTGSRRGKNIIPRRPPVRRAVASRAGGRGQRASGRPGSDGRRGSERGFSGREGGRSEGS